VGLDDAEIAAVLELQEMPVLDGFEYGQVHDEPSLGA
jgi:hypothetical protein